MAKQVGKKFPWVIKDFSSVNCQKYSEPVLIGDCKWRVSAYPNTANNLNLTMDIVDYKSLPRGWRRFVKYRLTIVRQVSEEPSVTKETHRWFDQIHTSFHFHSTIPLAKLNDPKEKFVINGELLIVAEVDIIRVIGTLEESQETNPLKKLKVESGSSVSERNKDLAVEFRVMNKEMKKASMNVLLSLTQMMCQTTPHELSIDDLVEAENAVAYMKNSGVIVDWLEEKLKEIKEKKE